MNRHPRPFGGPRARRTLQLRSETIARLTCGELRAVAGGMTMTEEYTCVCPLSKKLNCGPTMDCPVG